MSLSQASTTLRWSGIEQDQKNLGNVSWPVWCDQYCRRPAVKLTGGDGVGLIGAHNAHPPGLLLSEPSQRWLALVSFSCGPVRETFVEE